MTWWWLSFADPHKPRGQQFLGVAVVEVQSSVHKHGLREAMTLCHALGINPGGEVMGHPLGDALPPGMPHDVLMTKPQAEHWGQAIVRNGDGVRDA